MTLEEEIISLLPYAKPFLFVDSIEKIDSDSVTGTYTFNEQEFFYKGHFKDYPLTPGVILIETMAQIGLVCLGIFLLKDEISRGNLFGIVLASSDVEFLEPVYPGEMVSVISKKIYFRFGKLKCSVIMENSKGNIVGRGILSGMIRKKNE